MANRENPYFCPFFVEIAQSFRLKAPSCPNAVTIGDDGEIVKVCPKIPQECVILSDLEADVRASSAVLTDAELEQERLIAEWLREKGINPSSLL